MKTAMILFPSHAAQQAQALLCLVEMLEPSATPDVLILGDAAPSILPEGLGTVCCLPGPEPSQCLDLWLYYTGAADWAAQNRYDLILLTSEADHDMLAVSLANALHGCPVCNISTLTRLSDGSLCAVRNVCCMELDGRFALNAFPAVVTIQAASSGPESSLTEYPLHWLSAATPQLDWLKDFSCTPWQEDSLLTAHTVLIAGRGAGSDGVAKLETLAQRLGGKTGVTRPMVFEGMAPMDYLVGASASILAPRHCVVFGASGSAAFTVGVERSGTLIGVNSDPDAPLFSYCDYAIADDCILILDALLTLTEQGGIIP